MATYSISKIKTFNGREGQGLNATILKDGKPICYVLDDASGGEVDYDYRNPKQTAASFQATTKEMAAQEERELGDYCLSLLTDEERAQAYADVHQRNEAYAKHNNDYRVDVESTVRQDAVETWVNNFVDALQEKKQLDRLAKKKTLFRKPGEKYQDGEWCTLKVPYSPEVKAFLDKKYPGNTVYGVSA